MLQRLVRGLFRRTVPPKLRRRLRRVFRASEPANRPDSLMKEVAFWRTYLQTRGLGWPEDYRNRLDPDFPLQEHVAEVLDGVHGDELQVLDVGAGPLTKLGKRHPSKAFRITAVDVLASEYDRLLAEFEIDPPVRTIQGDAESLCLQFGEDSFHVVCAVNALDHADSPMLGLREMLAVVRPGGSVLLQHYEDEGEWEDYAALHQWNFTCVAGDFLIRDRHGQTTNVTQEFQGTAVTTCARHEIDGRTEIRAIMRKRP